MSEIQNSADSLNNFSKNSSNDKKIRELEEKKIFLEKKHEFLNHKIDVLKQANGLLEKKLLDDSKYKTEINQIKDQLDSLNKTLVEKFQKLEENSEITHKHQQILDKKINSSTLRKNSFTKKHFSVIMLSILTVSLLTTISAHSLDPFSNQDLIFDSTISHEPGFLIENLQGDTIDTWVSWRLVEDETLHVNIINADEFPDKVNSIKNVILSEELLRMDNSKLNENSDNSLSQYYVGWKGALEKASSEKNSKFNIPSNFDIIESSLGEGDIIIYLTNLKQGDGLSGTTKLIADASQNQIVKSITVLYEVDNLDELELETIMRHEFGHVLGLAHSTNVDDLMHPLFKTKYPYISECDVNALVTLYDGGKMSRVTCD